MSDDDFVKSVDDLTEHAISLIENHETTEQQKLALKSRLLYLIDKIDQ